MTQAQFDHLIAIDKHLAKRIEFYGNQQRFPGIPDCLTRDAEAGWKVAQMAIDLCITNLHTDPEFPTHAPGQICDNDGGGCRACEYTESILLEYLLQAFPLELIKP